MQGGKIGVTSDSAAEIPESLPPSVRIACGGFRAALGIDGVWRAWNPGSNRKVLGTFESNGITGEPVAQGGISFYWLDRESIIHHQSHTGVHSNLGEMKGRKAKKISGYGGRIFVCDHLDRWHYTGTENEKGERKNLLKLLKGSLTVTASPDHIFYVVP